jgi:hemerythrin-like metal-binding protein
MKEVFTWLPECSVGVKEIDEQHKQLISIMNTLFNSIDDLVGEKTLKDIINQIVAYAQYHFATEEKYFDLFNYEHTEEHKASHKKLLAHVSNFLSLPHKSIKQASLDLLDYLQDWMNEHLLYEDKKYTKCFNEHGLV